MNSRSSLGSRYNVASQGQQKDDPGTTLVCHCVKRLQLSLLFTMGITSVNILS